MSRPWSRTEPFRTRTRPRIAFSRVLLPAPFGPTIADTSPPPTLRLTPLITGSSPYPATTPSTTRMGSWRPDGPLTDDIRGLDVLSFAHLRHAPLREHLPRRHHDDRVRETLDD